MEYSKKFNELSHFAATQVATVEMRMDHFEQGLKGSIEKIVVGHAYASFQEMFQRAMKIARVMDETKVKNREIGQPKRKFSWRVQFLGKQ